MEPENQPLEKGDSFWKSCFSDSMLNFGGVVGSSTQDDITRCRWFEGLNRIHHQSPIGEQPW